MAAFGGRGTSGASLTPPNGEGLISPPPAYGDTISGTNLAGGIAAALLKRERTGEPSVVDVSLLGSGLWAMGHAVALSLHLGTPWVAPPQGSHGAMNNPLSGLYRTADGRRSEEHTSELQSHLNLVCRLLLEKKKHYTTPM